MRLAAEIGHETNNSSTLSLTDSEDRERATI